ncbi:MAG TPA: STAS domain-containing protein [Rhodocyclaceae bacterium]
MQVRRSSHDLIEVIRLEGRFDFSTHRLFRDAVKAALANAAAQEIQIDLAAVDYVDSSALGMLLLSQENAKAAGKTLALVGAAGVVKQVLDIANFQRLFVIR